MTDLYTVSTAVDYCFQIKGLPCVSKMKEFIHTIKILKVKEKIFGTIVV